MQDEVESNDSEAGDNLVSDVSEDNFDAESAYEAAETTDIQTTSESSGYYVVQKGDTLDGISRKIYGNTSYVAAICRMNGLTDGNLIIIGQKLLLP